jgi:hypothetical protein
MPDGLTNRQQQRLKKMLGFDYLKTKELKKKKRAEKATRQKDSRHRSRQQEIEDLLLDELQEEFENEEEQ